MTPQERKLVTDLFDRLATLEREPRDPDADRVIRDGLARAPNAVYALVQTVLLQDEALHTLHARVEALEGGHGPDAPSQGGFLDNLRDTILGRDTPPAPRGRGSVPSVQPGDSAGGGTRWNTGGALGGTPMGAPGGFGRGGTGHDVPPAGSPSYGAPPQAGGRGSFLGTAAAAAAGVVGGALLMDTVRNMIGGAPGASAQGAASEPGGGGSPWGDSGAGGGALSHQAGADDVGGGGRGARAFDDRPRDDSPTFERDEPGLETVDYDEDVFGSDDYGGDMDA